jgi:hypothetical protein
MPCGYRRRKKMHLFHRDEKVYFFEPLEKEISVEDMQNIVDANEKLVKELKDGTNAISR